MYLYPVFCFCFCGVLFVALPTTSRMLIDSSLGSKQPMVSRGFDSFLRFLHAAAYPPGSWLFLGFVVAHLHVAFKTPPAYSPTFFSRVLLLEALLLNTVVRGASRFSRCSHAVALSLTEERKKDNK